MVKLGLHVSITGSIDQAADRAREIGCDTFQMFTRNPRGWKFKKLGADEVKEFRRKVASYELQPAVAHMPYLPNLSSPKKLIFKKSLKSLITELERCSLLGIPFLVTHLGSHLGKGADVGLERIVSAINTALPASGGDVMLLLENTAGTKNSMGSRFEEIRKILDAVDLKERVGVCFDTAHAFGAGYDLRTAVAIEETFREFDSVLGLKLLKVIHLNDSQGDLACGRDRHEHLGLGRIGENGFRELFKRRDLVDLPFIMETPIDNRRDDVGNMKKARELSS